MKTTYDVHVQSFTPLVAPRELKDEIPMTDRQCDTVLAGRAEVERILRKEDPRLLVVAGPCSIHDEASALEYAERLRGLREKVSETLSIVMRVYFEKPRTTVGWKGLINDPDMDGSCDINTGLRKARKLLRDITDMGLPIGTEMLDPITPQYIAGLVTWAAIGARTTESQTHREMTSGLSMPVGFKNCTDGGLDKAINAMLAARAPQSFLGIDPEGKTAVVRTTGNPYTHIVLRGGKRPNYDSVSLSEAGNLLRAKGLTEAIMVDCSHANCNKQYQRQTVVWQDVINQRMDGNDAVIGLMLESFLHEGNQKMGNDPKALAYGVSVTDPCISWKTTEQIVLSAHEHLKANKTNGAAAIRYAVAA